MDCMALTPDEFVQLLDAMALGGVGFAFVGGLIGGLTWDVAPGILRWARRRFAARRRRMAAVS